MRVSDGGGRPAGGVSGAELQQCHRVAARGAAEAVAAPALEGGWDPHLQGSGNGGAPLSVDKTVKREARAPPGFSAHLCVLSAPEKAARSRIYWGGSGGQRCRGWRQRPSPVPFAPRRSASPRPVASSSPGAQRGPARPLIGCLHFYSGHCWSN